MNKKLVIAFLLVLVLINIFIYNISKDDVTGEAIGKDVASDNQKKGVPISGSETDILGLQPLKKTIDVKLKENIRWIILIASIIGLLILIFLLYFIFLRRPKKLSLEKKPWKEKFELEKEYGANYYKLKKLVENYRAYGYSNEQIKESALRSGWPNDLIDEIMRNIK